MNSPVRCPVGAFAFRSDKQYRPYGISESADAFYRDGHDRDDIVMRGITQKEPIAIRATEGS